MTVVYEDNHIVVVNKTSSEIVQGDKTGDTPLSEMVKQYLKEKYNKPGNVFIGVTHRLDRPVSGLVVFAKTSKALPRLNELYRPGMQTDTAIRVGTWRAIFQITFNGTSHLGQLATNLMMPSSFQIHLQ